MNKYLLIIAFISLDIFAKVNVVVTTPDLKYIVEQIGKDHVEVVSMIRGSDDPHFVMTRPDYLTKLSQADLFCLIGLDLEIGWVPLLLQQSRNIKIQKGQVGYCDSSVGVKILGEPTIMVDRSMGDMHIYGNPHYWLDPINTIQMASNVSSGLIRVDPLHKDAFEKNYDAFKSRMVSLTKQEIDKFKPFQNRKVAVFHDQFIYLANRFKFIANLSLEERPGIPPSSRYLEQIIQIMKADNIKVIVRGPYHNPQYTEFVASQIPGSIIVILPVSIGGLEGIDTYEKMIEYSLLKIRDALEKTGNSP
jgi:zinc/manganese transport system substrate-binding protein